LAVSGALQLSIAAISQHGPVRKVLAPPRLTSFVDWMDSWKSIFWNRYGFWERLFHAPLLFIFVPLFIALLIVGVYLRRTKKRSKFYDRSWSGEYRFVLILIDDPAK